MKTAVLLLVVSAICVPVAAREFTMTLLQPAPHEELVAGAKSVVEWSASNAPANLEEWEAFVSIDGGRTYAMRITPHLDTTIRRFEWTVPNLPGAEVTLMLRFGDEHDERSFVFRQRARIRGVASPLAMLFRPPPVMASSSGEEGAVAWVEGGRDGSGLREVSTAPSSFERPLTASSQRDDAAPAAATSRAPQQSVTASVADRVPFRTTRRKTTPRSIPRSADILSMSTRLNV